MSLNHDTVPEPDAALELFVDFANTLEYTRGEPEDAIPTPAALLAWLADHGLLTRRGHAAEAARLRRDPAEGERRLARFRELRRVLHAIAEGMSDGGRPTDAQLRDLNHILRHGVHYHQVEPAADGTRYTVTQIGDRLDQARATIATSLAHFLADDTPDRLRVCASDTCRYLFVDHSPTGRRRWCDMRTCGNQAKVARHRARRRQQAARGVPPVPPGG